MIEVLGNSSNALVMFRTLSKQSESLVKKAKIKANMAMGAAYSRVKHRYRANLHAD